MMPCDLNKIRTVILEPTAPGNVGSIARAMANFGLRDLVLVNPADIDYNRAREFACNGAHVIDRIRIVDSFDEAVRGIDCIIGTTRRIRRNEISVPPVSAAKIILKTLSVGTAAIIFGRERNGLLKEEKSKCTILSHIDTVDGPAGSINISHAAAVFYYEIFSMEKSDENRMGSVNKLLAAFEGMLKSDENYGSSELLQNTFKSIIYRAMPLDHEVKRLLKFFDKCASRLAGEK